jgi:hypothetical protein
MTALFEDLDIELSHERLRSRRGLDQNSVTGRNPSGMFHQYLCKFCYAGISHKNLL